jgi:hypothetical protein
MVAVIVRDEDKANPVGIQALVANVRDDPLGIEANTRIDKHHFTSTSDSVYVAVKSTGNLKAKSSTSNKIDIIG